MSNLILIIQSISIIFFQYIFSFGIDFNEEQPFNDFITLSEYISDSGKNYDIELFLRLLQKIYLNFFGNIDPQIFLVFVEAIVSTLVLYALFYTLSKCFKINNFSIIIFTFFVLGFVYGENIFLFRSFSSTVLTQCAVIYYIFKPDKSYKIKSIIFFLLGCAFHLCALLIALLTLFVFKFVDIEKISSFYHFLFGRIKINLFTITTITFLILVPYIIANFKFIIPMETIISVYKIVPIIASKMVHYGPGFVYANEDIKFPTMVVFKSLFLFFIPMFFARNIFTIDSGSVHYKYIKNYKYLILIFFMFLICSVLSFVFSGTLSIRILQLSKPLLVFNFAIIINIYRKLNANYKNIIYLMNIINFLLFVQLITRADLGCRTLKCVLF